MLSKLERAGFPRSDNIRYKALRFNDEALESLPSPPWTLATSLSASKKTWRSPSSMAAVR